MFRKHCAMDTGSEAGMTDFVNLQDYFGVSALAINFAATIYKYTAQNYSRQQCLTKKEASRVPTQFQLRGKEKLGG